MDLYEFMQFDMAMIIGIVVWIITSAYMIKTGAFANVGKLWEILFLIIWLPLAILSVKYWANKG